MDAAKRQLARRTFTDAERAVLSELYQMADACSTSTKDEVQNIGIFVMERMRRIIEGDTELYNFNDAQLRKVCRTIKKLRKYLPGAPRTH